MKNDNDGSTNQKTFLENNWMFSTSFVSMYIQRIAKNDINGMDAKIAPIIWYFFDISDIITIKVADIMIFNA